MAVRALVALVLMVATVSSTAAESDMCEMAGDEVALLQEAVSTRRAASFDRAAKEWRAAAVPPGPCLDQVHRRSSCDDEECPVSAAPKVLLEGEEETLDAGAGAAHWQLEHPVTEAAAGAPTGQALLSWGLYGIAVLVAADGLSRLGRSPLAPAGAGGKAPAPKAETTWQLTMKAAMAGDAAECEALLPLGPSMVETDLWGCTLLHAAAKGGSASVVKQLLESGAFVDQRDIWDETPLFLAARAGHREVCEILVASGANADAVNADGCAPFPPAPAEEAAVEDLKIE